MCIVFYEYIPVIGTFFMNADSIWILKYRHLTRIMLFMTLVWAQIDLLYPVLLKQICVFIAF